MIIVEIRVLQYFLMVAREENITRAANQLHMTQPTLSRQLMQLEEELQTPLFIRGKRKIELTEAGRLLRRRAEEIVSLVDKTEIEVMQNEEMSGEIMIGTGVFDASQIFLPQVIESFHEDYPQVRFDIYTGNADLIKDRLDNGLVDIGILLEPVDIEKYNFIRLPKKERWGIIISKNHELANNDTVSADDLKKINLLSTNRTIVQSEIFNSLNIDTDDIDFPVTYNFISTILPLIKKNIGAAVSVEGAYKAYNQEDVVFLPFSPQLSTGVVIVWKKHYTLSRILKKFITLIEKNSKKY